MSEVIEKCGRMIERAIEKQTEAITQAIREASAPQEQIAEEPSQELQGLQQHKLYSEDEEAVKRPGELLLRVGDELQKTKGVNDGDLIVFLVDGHLFDPGMSVEQFLAVCARLKVVG